MKFSSMLQMYLLESKLNISVVVGEMKVKSLVEEESL